MTLPGSAGQVCLTQTSLTFWVSGRAAGKEKKKGVGWAKPSCCLLPVCCGQQPLLFLLCCCFFFISCLSFHLVSSYNPHFGPKSTKKSDRLINNRNSQSFCHIQVHKQTNVRNKWPKNHENVYGDVEEVKYCLSALFTTCYLTVFNTYMELGL